MSNTNDEQIQKMLEEMGDHGAEDLFADRDPLFRKDTKMYQLLFEELKNLPADDLPADFARQITAQLAARQKHANAGRGEVALVASLAVAGVLLAFGLMIYIDGDTIQLAMTVWPKALLVIAFAFICFLVVQSLESNLLKKKYGLR
jgi:hypothetical protein